MTTVVAADAATAPPSTAAGYRRNCVPVAALMTASERFPPPGASSPTVKTPCQARTEMICVPAGASSVLSQRCSPSDSA